MAQPTTLEDLQKQDAGIEPGFMLDMILESLGEKAGQSTFKATKGMPHEARAMLATIAHTAPQALEFIAAPIVAGGKAVKNELAKIANADPLPRNFGQTGAIMFRGTSDKPSGPRDPGDIGVGIYRSPSEFMAKQYAESSARRSGGKPIINKLDSYAENTKTFSMAEKERFAKLNENDPNHAQRLTEKLQAEGYDSAQVVDGRGNIVEHVSFNKDDVYEPHLGSNPLDKPKAESARAKKVLGLPRNEMPSDKEIAQALEEARKKQVLEFLAGMEDDIPRQRRKNPHSYGSHKLAGRLKKEDSLTEALHEISKNAR